MFLTSERPFSWISPLAACNPFCPRSSTEIRIFPDWRAEQGAEATALLSVPVAFHVCLGVVGIVGLDQSSQTAADRAGERVTA